MPVWYQEVNFKTKDRKGNLLLGGVLYLCRSEIRQNKLKSIRTGTRSQRSFRNIINAFWEVVKEDVLRGIVVYLPEVGSFRIKKIRTTNKNKKIDWKSTLEKGKYVYYDNRHTGFYAYYLRFVQPRGNKERFHRIKALRSFKLKLSKKIREGQDYL